MWVFPPHETLGSSESSSSSADPESETSSGFRNTSLNNPVEHVAKSFSSVNKDYQHPEIAELLDELINWSKCLDPCLATEFENEKVTSHKVLKKWLPNLCEAIFNPQNPLFSACPNDPTKFYPNPGLHPEPFNLDCMRFAGKVIALALRYKIELDVAFDRSFLMQLVGENISVEDVKDADPSLYSMCNNILHMNDVEFAANYNGGSMNFNCKDKEAYVSKLIHNQFVTPIGKHVSSFTQGFDSVFGQSILQLLSLSGLEFEDLNQMLRGNKIAQGNRKSYSLKYNESDSRTSRFQKITRRRPCINHWQKGQLLGHGSYGPVYEGFAAEGFFFAVNEIELSNSESLLKNVRVEIALLSQLNHENIVQYYGTQTTESSLYIFMELVSKGTLENLYKKYPLQDSQVSGFTRQILQGLVYLHEENVIHMDIRCQNILVDVNGYVKLLGSALAKVIGSRTKSFQGTPSLWWMAPEIVNSSKENGVQADIWSLGFTVLEMLTRQIPYYDLESQQAMFKIAKGELPSIPDSLTSDSRDFILQCLQFDPESRPTAANLLGHPYLVA